MRTLPCVARTASCDRVSSGTRQPPSGVLNLLGPVATNGGHVGRRRAALLELGVRPRLASSTAGSWLGPWYFAKTKALSVGLSNAHFKSLGLPLRTQATSINIPVNTQDRHTEKLKLRESLTAEIVADVEQEIDDVLAWAPDNLTEKERKAIRDEVIAQTRHVTDALITEELQNEGARRAYTCGAVATVRHMINLRMAQTKRD